MSSEEDSFFSFGDDSFSNIDDMLNDSYSGIEDSGEGDTDSFFQDLFGDDNTTNTQQKQSTPIVSDFDKDIAKLEEDSLNDLEGINQETNNNYQEEEEPVSDFNLEEINTDDLISMLNNDNEENFKDELNQQNIPSEPVVNEDLEPLIEEYNTPNQNIEKDEEVIYPIDTDKEPEPAQDNIVEEEEDLIPLIDENIEQDTIKDDLFINNEDNSMPKQEIFEESIKIPTLDTLTRIIKILDTYESFTDDEKHSMLLLLYSGSIKIEARDKVVQKILSITESEKLTIKTLKELKQLDSVERAFSLMGLDNKLLADVSELVYYISDNEMPKGLSKIDLSREVVKYVEKLKPDIVGYIDKAEEIVSI